VIKLPAPQLNAVEVFNDCVRGFASAELREKFFSVSADFYSSFKEYSQKASAAELHGFRACAHGGREQRINGEITKGDLYALYNSQMVPEGCAGRSHYNLLMISAPLNKCPYCGIGRVSTLDHYLSKSRYPAFAVLPENLVPACADCNKVKGGGVFEADSATLHPYFEPVAIFRECWLKAEVHNQSPVVVSFKVIPPHAWEEALKKRIVNHFEDFELARRFSVEAASEIASIEAIFQIMHGPEDKKTHVANTAQAEFRLNSNSWKAAMYSALSKSDWFFV